jgi:molybdate transport system substrate-binding protein
MADTIRILSAGAPKTGVSRCAKAYEEATGHKAEITFATAPVVRQSVESGEDDADVVVATVPVVDGFEAAGLTVPGARATVGSVKAAVAVKAGTPFPDISSADSLRAAILAAPAVLYNSASSGLYIEKMMETLGVADEIRDRTIRLPNGDAVLKHLGSSETPGEIGFGQATEIRRQEELDGLVAFVGALPKEVENITTYAVALLPHARNAEAARGLVAFMGSAAGLKIFAATGVE